MSGWHYERDGQAIYRQSFAIIRAEADLSAFDDAEAEVAVRMIHACGLVEAVVGLRSRGFSAGCRYRPFWLI